MDHAYRWDEDSAQRGYRRDPPHAGRREDELKWDVLAPALPPQIPEGARLFPQSSADASMRDRNKHARSEEWDAVFFRIEKHELAAFASEFRLQRAARFVEPRMNHATVEA